MLLTEEESRERWCPHVRAMNFAPAIDHNPAVNRPTADYHCIGSACMAWRWACGPRNYTHAAESERRKYPPNGRGYCGLAGRPEE
ncbi:MAG TPA: hypothetical protein VF226_01680 [Hyphomicrobiaceae bacterium]